MGWWINVVYDNWEVDSRSYLDTSQSWIYLGQSHSVPTVMFWTVDSVPWCLPLLNCFLISPWFSYFISSVIADDVLNLLTLPVLLLALRSHPQLHKAFDIDLSETFSIYTSLVL
jgi:hypothetical protein